MLYQDFDVRGAFQRFTNLSADVYRRAYTPSKFRTLHERLTLLLYLYLSIWSGKIFIILIREELKASKVKFSQRFLSGRFEFSCRDLFININTRKTFGNECAEIRAEKTFERQRKGTGTRSNLSRTKIMARDANDVTFKRWMEFVRGTDLTKSEEWSFKIEATMDLCFSHNVSDTRVWDRPRVLVDLSGE